MTRLTRYIQALSNHSRVALVTAGMLGTLIGAPAETLAGNFLQQMAESAQYGQRGTYHISDARTAAAFNARISDNLSDLLDLSRSMRRVDLYGQFSGRDTAKKINQAYLYAYSQASYPELRQYDRMSLAVARGTADRRVTIIVNDASRKKAVLRDGTTLVDEITKALSRENYDRAQHLVAQFSSLMETRGAPLLERQEYPDRPMAYSDDDAGIGFSFGR